MNWRDILKENIVDIEQLGTVMPDIAGHTREYRDIIDKYPMSITKYYLSLINKENPKDAIAKMCLPSLSEGAIEGEADTSGENENTVLPGLQHKYIHTALILSTNRCAMYCRYCFRKRMVGTDDHEILKQQKAAFEYIDSHKEINNVLISGGDPLLNDNDIIESYLQTLCDMEHLDFIRFGTKVPVVLPQRISYDQELLKILAKYTRKKRIYFVTQFNHINEITNAAITAIKSLQDIGIVIKNQSVLMREVNDDPMVLSELLRRLTTLGIVPYYIFQCRPVRGVKTQFQVPIEEGISIIEQAKALQNGQGKCFKYVISLPAGKIEILGRDPQGQILFRYHEAKNESLQGRIINALPKD
ncbi:MAG: KamA family radical SAM protein [Bacillota bacterium]|nr:KamA family radical SAM protein [Bacillota bacterium]